MRILSGSVVLSSSAHTHMHCGSSLSPSCQFHVHGHPCGLFTLILLFYFLLYFPLFFFFFNYLKSVHNSFNESMDSTDEFSLSTYSPTTYCAWEVSVEIQLKFGSRRSIGFRTHLKIENWIEWGADGVQMVKFSRIHCIANSRRDSKHDD